MPKITAIVVSCLAGIFPADKPRLARQPFQRLGLSSQAALVAQPFQPAVLQVFKLLTLRVVTICRLESRRYGRLESLRYHFGFSLELDAAVNLECVAIWSESVVVKSKLRNFLLSLPERGVRSISALAAGLFREVGEVSIPQSIRRSRLYGNLVEATLRFLIEQVGQVKGVYPNEEKLAEDFLVRRAAGNGIELMGILAFRASPVWVLAALADASGAGRYLVREITSSLKEEGLLDPSTEFSGVDEMLDGLEASASRMAATVNTPPLDVGTLRKEWKALRRDLSRIPPKQLPSIQALGHMWSEMKDEAHKQNQTVFQVASLMALSAITNVPQKARWLSASARSAALKTGTTVASVLLEDYRTTLKRIRETGYVRYAARQFRPYLFAAVSQFSPRRTSLTEKLLTRGSRRRSSRRRRQSGST